MEALQNLGKKITQFRKKAGITQEQLAEQLNVSVSAVSQWETGKTFPDISAIPILCRVLDVTSDELLDINREKDEAEIRRIKEEAEGDSSRGHLVKAEKILSDALKQFPNNYDLMVSLLNVEYAMAMNLNAEDESKSRQVLQKCVSTAQKILEGCKDAESLSCARQILCYSYDCLGEDEKAAAIANEMPSLPVCRESLLAMIGRGQKQLENKRTEVNMLLTWLCMRLNFFNVENEDGSREYTASEEAAIVEKVIDLLGIIFENGDYGFFHDRLMCAHLQIARLAARGEQDKEKTLRHLSEAVAHAEAFMQNCGEEGAEKHVHTSLILRGTEFGDFEAYTDQNNTAEVLEEMQNDYYDFVRDNSEFQALSERLKKTAGKWS